MSTQGLQTIAAQIIQRLKKIQAPTAPTYNTARDIVALCHGTTQMINAFNAAQTEGLLPGMTYYQLVPDCSGQAELLQFTTL